MGLEGDLDASGTASAVPAEANVLVDEADKGSDSVRCVGFYLQFP